MADCEQEEHIVAGSPTTSYTGGSVVDLPTPTASDDIGLEFPRMQLRTSFQSLLSHSVSSSATEMPPASVVRSLDDSWASLDVSDFSQDDDGRSDNIENESLVDLSSAYGAEMAVVEEAGNEPMQQNKDRGVASTTKAGNARVAPKLQPCPVTAMDHLDDSDDGDDSILLARSETQSDPDAIEVEYTRLPDPDAVDRHNSPIRDTISMSISPEYLKLGDEPFKIAYYGTTATQKTREELLGKIGAALIAGSVPAAAVSAKSPSSSSSSPCFNIIPTEFGNGLQPTFADLIPSQARMTIDELKAPWDVKDTDFILLNGKLHRSTPRLFNRFASSWRPDLLVVHVSQDDAAEDFTTFRRVVSVARSHHWPVLVVAETDIWESVPELPVYAINRTRYVEQGLTTQVKRLPIDLESLMTIDSTQLNQALHLITTKAQKLFESQSTCGGTLKMLAAAGKDLLASVPLSRGVERLAEYGLGLEKARACTKAYTSTLAAAASRWTQGQSSTQLGMIGIVLCLASLLPFLLFAPFSVTPVEQSAAFDLSTHGPAQVQSSASQVVPTLSDSTRQVTAPTDIGRVENDLVVYDFTNLEQAWKNMVAKAVSKVEESSNAVYGGKVTTGLGLDLAGAVVRGFSRLRSAAMRALQNDVEVMSKVARFGKEKLWTSVEHAHQSMTRHRKRHNMANVMNVDVNKLRPGEALSTVMVRAHSITQTGRAYWHEALNRQRMRAGIIGDWCHKHLKGMVSGPKRHLSAAQKQAIQAYEMPQRKYWFGRRRDEAL